MSTCAHQLCCLCTGQGLPPWIGPGGQRGSWANGSGRLPQEEDVEWVPGGAWLAGVFLRHLWFPGAFLCPVQRYQASPPGVWMAQQAQVLLSSFPRGNLASQTLAPWGLWP